jgi:hypothetical protein
VGIAAKAPIAARPAIPAPSVAETGDTNRINAGNANNANTININPPTNPVIPAPSSPHTSSPTIRKLAAYTAAAAGLYKMNATNQPVAFLNHCLPISVFVADAVKGRIPTRTTSIALRPIINTI